MVFAIHCHESATGAHVSTHPECPIHLPPHPIPLGCPRALILGALLHTSNLHWSSILHMVIYIFQCYSPKLSHLHLLPQSPKVCSLHLCLFSCLAYRIIITIFVNSTYMCCYTVLVEREMATHSSILAWRILWMEEPSGLLSMGLHRVRHNWSDLACMHALEKEMATHSSILVWRTPGTEEPGGLLSMGSYRVRHD